MFLRRKSWAQLTRGGVTPPLYVVRPKEQFTGAFGEPYPVSEDADKLELMRARQLYEQKRVGIHDEVALMRSKYPQLAKGMKNGNHFKADK